MAANIRGMFAPAHRRCSSVTMDHHRSLLAPSPDRLSASSWPLPVMSPDPPASAIVGARPALVNATRFRAAREADWAHLDALLKRMEKRSIRILSDDDVLALPILYRTTLS